MASPLNAKAARARARRRERLKADLRAIVLQACCAFGLLLTLPWALSAPAARVECPVEAAICFQGVNSTLVPILLRSGVGLAAGMAVGVLLCVAVPGLKRRAA